MSRFLSLGIICLLVSLPAAVSAAEESATGAPATEDLEAAVELIEEDAELGEELLTE